MVANGFVFSSVDCAMKKVMVGNNREEPPRDSCAKSKRRGRLYINRVYKPHVDRAHPKTNIEHIENDPGKANIEIVALRKENKRLNRKLTQKLFKGEMEANSVDADVVISCCDPKSTKAGVDVGVMLVLELVAFCIFL